MTPGWLTATTAVPTVTLVSLVGWAALATALGLGHWWMYHRAPGAVEATTPPVAWDDQPAEPIPAAQRTRETA